MPRDIHGDQVSLEEIMGDLEDSLKPDPKVQAEAADFVGKVFDTSDDDQLELDFSHLDDDLNEIEDSSVTEEDEEFGLDFSHLDEDLNEIEDSSSTEDEDDFSLDFSHLDDDLNEI